MKLNQQRLDPKDGKIIDKIMVSPRSRGSLGLDGEYSKTNRHPSYTVNIHATVKDNVFWQEKLLGSPEHYVVRIEVENKNDSPAFVELERVEVQNILNMKGGENR